MGQNTYQNIATVTGAGLLSLSAATIAVHAISGASLSSPWQYAAGLGGMALAAAFMNYREKRKAREQGDRIPIMYWVTPKTLARMDLVKKKVGRGTYGSLMDNALRNLDADVELHELGNRFSIITPSGDVVPLQRFYPPPSPPEDTPPETRPTFTVISGGKLPE